MVHYSTEMTPQRKTTYSMEDGEAVVGDKNLRKQDYLDSHTATVTQDTSNSTLATESCRTDHSRGLSSCTSSLSSQRSTSSQTTSTTLQWWQRCTIRQSVSFLEDDIEHVISESPFLQKHQHHEEEKSCALFHRSEIITGSLLGQGGFSDVYEIIGFELDDRVSSQMSIVQRKLRAQTAYDAIDPISGRGRFVIKHLQEKLILNAKKNQANCKRDFELAASDLVVEVAYMSALNHPNILSIRGLPFRGIRAFQDGNHDSYFFICDRLQDTLDKCIHDKWNNERTEPSIEKRASYALQLSEALQYLHQQNIIFRDLKPQNIGFSVNDHDKILLFDFGLCRELPSDVDITDPNMMFEMSGVGTRRYMAPEIVNESRYNLKADVYSWSMVFWEMLTLVKPYALYSFEQHRAKVCRDCERPEMKHDWPFWLQRLLIQCWNESVEDRLSITEVAETLSRFLPAVNKSQMYPYPSASERNYVHQQTVVYEIESPVVDSVDMKKHGTVYDSFFCIPHCTSTTTDDTRSISTSEVLLSSELRFHSNPDWLASLADDEADDTESIDRDSFCRRVLGDVHQYDSTTAFCNQFQSLAEFTHDDGGVEVQLLASESRGYTGNIARITL